jgi:hypothetical protein
MPLAYTMLTSYVSEPALQVSHVHHSYITDSTSEHSQGQSLYIQKSYNLIKPIYFSTVTHSDMRFEGRCQEHAGSHPTHAPCTRTLHCGSLWTTFAARRESRTWRDITTYSTSHSFDWQELRYGNQQQQLMSRPATHHIRPWARGSVAFTGDITNMGQFLCTHCYLHVPSFPLADTVWHCTAGAKTISPSSESKAPSLRNHQWIRRSTRECVLFGLLSPFLKIHGPGWDHNG